MIDKKKFNYLEALFKTRAIYQLLLEELEMWEGFDILYPSYLYFSECLVWSKNNTCNRRKAIIDIQKRIARGYKEIKKVLGIKRGFSDERVKAYLKKHNEALEIHLAQLRKLRDKREKELEGKTK